MKPRTYPQLPSGQQNVRVVPRRITRNAWSKPRIFYGEKVDLLVNTNFVDDGTACKLEVLNGEEVIETLDGTITEEAYVHKDFELELPEPKPADSPYAITFRVELPDFQVTSEISEPIQVHVEGFGYSC